MQVKLDIEQPCSWEEHAARIETLRQQLRARKLDTMLVTSLHSIYYLFGIDRLVSAGVFVGTLVSVDKPTITISYYEHDLIFQQSPLVGELRYWEKDYLEAADQVAKAYADQGAPRRVGVESDHSAVPPNIYIAIESRLRKAGAEIVEAADIVTRMRVVKSPAETKCMRRAAEILDIHFEAAFKAMKPGARECDVAGKAVEASYAAGGDYCIHPPLLTSGVNTLFRTFHAPSRRELQRGDMIVLEAGAAYQRYNVVACHTVICGADPTPEQRRDYAASRDQVDATLVKLKPGVRVAELMGGNGPVMIYSTGIGFQDVWYEGWPLYTEGNNDTEWILRPGTFLSVFGGAERAGKYMMLCVDPVVITETGYELLTHINRSELRVVG